MKSLVLALLASCAHNYAETYVAALNPDAEVIARGDQSVVVWVGSQVAACRADATHHTECHLIADWTQKPQGAPAPAKTNAPTVPPMPQPAQPPPSAPEACVPVMVRGHATTTCPSESKTP
jgi:hypothetical protein